jgi:hypothetical protein
MLFTIGDFEVTSFGVLVAVGALGGSGSFRESCVDQAYPPRPLTLPSPE